MADSTMYAWSPIRYGATTDSEGNFTGIQMVNFGDSVSKSKLGVDDENWNALVEAGVVRDYAPPKEYSETTPVDESPVQFLQRQAREAAELAEGAVMSMGGSYFGPNQEEIYQNPELLTGEKPKEK